MEHPRATLVRLGRGREILAWLARTVVVAGRWRVPLALISSAAGILLQAAAFGVIVLFVHVQTSGAPVEVGGWTVPAAVTPVTVAAWSLTVLAVAFLGAGAVYLGEATAFTAGNQAMQHAIGQGLDALVRAARSPVTYFTTPDATVTARRAIVSDATSVLRTSLQLFRFTVAAIGFAVYFGFLVAVDPMLTILVVLLLVLSLGPLYWLNLGVVAASRDYETHRKTRATVMSRFLQYAASTPPPTGASPAWTDAARSHPALASATGAFRHIILARRRVGFLQQLLFGVVLAAVFVLHVTLSEPGDPRWGPLVTYLIAFRLAAAHMTKAATLLTAINRFLPQLKRIYEFVGAKADETPADEERDDDDDAVVRLRAVDKPLPGSERTHALTPGTVTMAVVDAIPNAYTFPDLCRRMTRSGSAGVALVRQSALCLDFVAPPPLPLCTLLAGVSDPDRAVRARAETLAASWKLPLDRPLDDRAWTALSLRQRLELQLAPALLAERAVIWIAWRVLSALQPVSRLAVLEPLSDRAVVLLASPPPLGAPPVVGHTAVFYDGAVHGMGSPRWYAELDHERLRVEAFDTRSGAVQIDDEDAWDDDEED